MSGAGIPGRGESGGDDTSPEHRLAAAYAATTYIVELPGGPAMLRVGAASPALDAWLASAGCREWVWLTAVNPGSHRCADGENAARLAELAALVDGRGRPWVRGRAVADDGAWPDEPSLLVAGLPVAEGVTLARRFGQAAILAGVAGGGAALVWIEGAP